MVTQFKKKTKGNKFKFPISYKSVMCPCVSNTSPDSVFTENTHEIHMRGHRKTCQNID